MNAVTDSARGFGVSWALVRKELAESRAALAAGLAIMVGLPLVLIAVYLLVDSDRVLLNGLPSGLLAIGGWLFGAILGAQTATRDWGRPQGDFLLARPITPRQVLRAKAAAGCGIILVLLLSTGLLEWLLSFGHRLLCTEAEQILPVLAVAAAFTYAAFWLALTAGTITRKTLSAAMLAALVLVLALLLPWITTISVSRASGWEPALLVPILGQADLLFPDSYGETAGRGESRAVLAVAAFWALAYLLLRTCLQAARRGAVGTPWGYILRALLVFGVASATLRFKYGVVLDALLLAWIVTHGLFALAGVAARSSHGLRLGSRGVAWTAALAVVVCFTLSMGEVGANMPLATTVWIANRDGNVWGLREARALSGNRLVVGEPLGFPFREIYGQWTLYDIHSDGSLGPPRRIDVAEPWTGREYFEFAMPVFNQQGELFAFGRRVFRSNRVPFAPPPESDRRETQYLMKSVNWATGEVGAPMPVDPPPSAARWVYGLQDATFAGGRPYLLFVSHGSARTLPVLASYEPRGESLRVADSQGIWVQSRGALSPRLTQYGFEQWMSRPDFRQAGDGRWFVRTIGGWGGSLMKREIGADVFVGSGPSAKAEPRPKNLPSNPDWFSGEENSLPLRDHIYAGAGRTRLQIVAPREPNAPQQPDWVTVGTAYASPAAWLFRAETPDLLAAGPKLVWEIHSSHAICYDVSDPTRPRRIGHVTSRQISSALADDEFLVLNHGDGFSVVKNPRPARR